MIVIAGGITYGPFAAVQALGDRLVCDGAHLPFSVLGDYVVEDANPAPEIKQAVPVEVTRRKAMQILIKRGYDVVVQQRIDEIPDEMMRKLAQAEYDTSQVFERHRPLVGFITSAIPLTDDEVDQLFIEAEALP